MKSHGLSRLIVPGTDPSVVAEYEAYARRARDAVFGFEEEVVFVDIETTGFDPTRDAIIEIAAARAKGTEILERFSTFVAPGRPVPLEIVRLTGIDDAMLEGAPSAETAVSSLLKFVGGRDVIAHNVSFDRSFLERIAGPAAFRGAWLDSLQLSLIALPRLSSHRLRDLAEAFGSHLPTHRAIDDVEALAFLWRVMLCGLEQLPGSLLQSLSTLAPGAEWPVRSVLAHMGAGKKSNSFDLKRVRADRIGTGRVEALADAEEVVCSCPSVGEVVSEFSDEGLAGRMYPGFEVRDEQGRMAEAVVDAFTRGDHVAIEAGTGVGKSLAYLVPAARFALANGVGVGVATKTNSLADQLVYSELPALVEALNDEGVGPLRYVALKGYEHYPCLRKVERHTSSFSDASDVNEVAAYAALMAWIAQSDWGDLDATNIHWRRPLRAALTAAVGDCTHKRCRFYPNLCYLHGARRRASSAHIVVTNHALLFRDVVAEGGILPPLRHWVIDEAHAAEAEARKQLSLTASKAELSVVLGGLRAGSRGGGALDNVRRAVRAAALDDPTHVQTLLAQMEDTVANAATLADSLFEFVRDLGSYAPDAGYDTRELRITRELREAGPWATVAGVGSSLVKRLDSIVADGRALVTRLEELGPKAGDVRADLVGLLSRAAAQRDALVAVIDGEDLRFVYSVTLDRRPNSNIDRIAASLLDVGEVLAQDFFPRTRTAIFTSATIAAGDDFSHFARAVGLDRLPEDSWRTLRLESSYDFERQMAIFVPSDVEPPTSKGYQGSIEQLLFDVHVAMGGSVLTLFTNRRDMDAIHRMLEPRLRMLGQGLIVQGRGTSAKRIRDEFLADERLSLFATKSFWEGFDAKGDTLRCVVVPKLPFGPVNDPLLEERKERDGAWWAHYYLPEAIIELKQAAGRLIRSSTDVGCMVLADTRVVGGKSYGRRFLSALPVRDIEVCPAAEVARRMGERFGRQSE